MSTKIIVASDITFNQVTLSCEVPEEDIFVALTFIKMPMDDDNEIMLRLAEDIGRILLNVYNLSGLELEVVLVDFDEEEE